MGAGVGREEGEAEPVPSPTMVAEPLALRVTLADALLEAVSEREALVLALALTEALGGMLSAPLPDSEALLEWLPVAETVNEARGEPLMPPDRVVLAERLPVVEAVGEARGVWLVEGEAVGVMSLHKARDEEPAGDSHPGRQGRGWRVDRGQ